MSRIKSKNTKPEIIVRKMLHGMGYRFRLHNKYLPGKPDICMPRYNIIIFVHGCFWHHHNKCQDGKIPKSNISYWKHKIERNICRDKKHQNALKELGWRVIIVWECELKDQVKLQIKIENEVGKRPIIIVNNVQHCILT